MGMTSCRDWTLVGVNCAGTLSVCVGGVTRSHVCSGCVVGDDSKGRGMVPGCACRWDLPQMLPTIYRPQGTAAHPEEPFMSRCLEVISLLPG